MFAGVPGVRAALVECRRPEALELHARSGQHSFTIQMSPPAVSPGTPQIPVAALRPSVIALASALAAKLR